MPSVGCNKAVYDIAVIGAGINGAGIAADAAGRGLKVLLCEQHDLAAHTSSASSKLIHGGIRYLEQLDFALVRKSLIERQVLLDKAPHLIRPLRFVMPHQPRLRPAWLIRLGLVLYDHLYWHNTLARSEAVRFDAHSPLKAHFKQGFAYSDCQVDDARLVIANVQAAAAAGAEILTHTCCSKARRVDEHWELTLAKGAETFKVQAKALINSTGAWAEQFLSEAARLTAPPLRWVKGSHIVLPKLYEGMHAYILQNHDRRVVFAIPYKGRFTLIGTTDVDYLDDPANVEISQAEQDYLLKVCADYFKQPVTQADICHSFSGLRALWQLDGKSASKASRDYQLLLEKSGPAPLLSVYGGKLTTYRVLAEEALALLKPFLPHMSPNWTANSLLPGAKASQSAEDLATALQSQHSWLDPALALRLSASYGTNAWQLLGDASSTLQLGEHFGAGLYKREVDYLCTHEWAQSTEDIVWRRSQLGLELSPAQLARLSAYLSKA